MKNQVMKEKAMTIDAKLLSFTAVAAIIGAGLATAAGVSAYGGGMMGFQGGLDAEKHEEMQSALESGDYTAWSEVAGTNMLSEERFNTMLERHTLNMERHEAMEEALEANSFEAWTEFIAESDDWGRGRLSEVVTEENFPKFVEMHEAIEAGEYEKAKEIRTELGLGIPMRDGSGQGFKNNSERGQRGQGMGNGGMHSRFGN